MSIIKKITTSVIFLGLMSSTALADHVHPASHESVGKSLAKIRAGYSSMSNSTGSSVLDEDIKVKGGFLGEVALGYHFAENVAFECSVGYNKAKLTFTGAPDTAVNLIPVTALLQYYFVPEATLSPYVGAGYSYQIASGGSNGLSLASGGAPVGQLGFDVLFDNLIADNTVGLNFDLKYTYKARHNISYKAQSQSQTSFPLKNKVSTVAAAIGVVFQF